MTSCSVGVVASDSGRVGVAVAEEVASGRVGVASHGVEVAEEVEVVAAAVALDSKVTSGGLEVAMEVG